MVDMNWITCVGTVDSIHVCADLDNLCWNCRQYVYVCVNLDNLCSNCRQYVCSMLVLLVWNWITCVGTVDRILYVYSMWCFCGTG